MVTPLQYASDGDSPPITLLYLANPAATTLYIPRTSTPIKSCFQGYFNCIIIEQLKLCLASISISTNAALKISIQVHYIRSTRASAVNQQKVTINILSTIPSHSIY